MEHPILKEVINPATALDGKALRSWLIERSAPAWLTYGVDQENGGFFERLKPNLLPTDEPRRARLVARQIYFFSAAAELGWPGPADSLIQHGLSFLLEHLVSPDGRVAAACSADGSIIDKREFLYDTAFVLVALAKVAFKFPVAAEIAGTIADRLCTCFVHPLGGYIELDSLDVQCANPHMHLFEAFIAWASLETSRHPFWKDRASELADLALSRLSLQESGALPEHFDAQWNPIRTGKFLRIEPGHQFEWSWLLARWASMAGSSDASEASARLCVLAETHGVDLSRNCAVEALNEELIPTDYTARLWQQTERAKAWHAQSLLFASNEAIDFRRRALNSVFLFLRAPTPGLWFDEMAPDGSFVMQPVKASSGYHIACAAEFLLTSSLNTDQY